MAAGTYLSNLGKQSNVGFHMRPTNSFFDRHKKCLSKPKSMAVIKKGFSGGKISEWFAGYFRDQQATSMSELAEMKFVHVTQKTDHLS